MEPCFNFPLFVSPWLGRPLPDLAALRSWANEDGKSILDAAAKLAAWRTQQVPEISIDLPAPLRNDVTRTDLLRAIVALQPDALGIERVQDFKLGDAPARWTRTIDDAPTAGTPQLVEPTLARTWLLQRVRSSTSVLGDPELVGALGFEGALALSAFDAQYYEGLITRRESACRILDGQWAANRGGMTAIPVCPIYLDRWGHLAEIDEALARSSGVVIVADGREGAGHSLLEAWLQRLAYQRSPQPLAALFPWSALQTLDVRRLNNDFFSNQDHALLIQLRRGGGGGYLDLQPAIGFVPGWVSDLVVMADDARARGIDGTFLVVTTSGHEHQLGDADPLYSTVPRIVVREHDDSDLLALWWCQKPMIERRTGTCPTLSSLIEAFVTADEKDRRRSDWVTVARALERLRASRAFDVRLYDPSPPSSRWGRCIRAAREGKDVAAAERDVIEHLLGSVDRLVEVVDADDELHWRYQDQLA